MILIPKEREPKVTVKEHLPTIEARSSGATSNFSRKSQPQKEILNLKKSSKLSTKKKQLSEQAKSIKHSNHPSERLFKSVLDKYGVPEINKAQRNTCFVKNTNCLMQSEEMIQVLCKKETEIIKLFKKTETLNNKDTPKSEEVCQMKIKIKNNSKSDSTIKNSSPLENLKSGFKDLNIMNLELNPKSISDEKLSNNDLMKMDLENKFKFQQNGKTNKFLISYRLQKIIKFWIFLLIEYHFIKY